MVTLFADRCQIAEFTGMILIMDRGYESIVEVTGLVDRMEASQADRQAGG